MVPTYINKKTFTVNNLQAKSLVAVIEIELVAEFIFTFHCRNIANNPFDCTCDLMPFRNELVTLEAKGLELLDRNNVNCSNAPTVNLLDQSSERFWCKHVYSII